MKILISGSSGLVGSAFKEYLSASRTNFAFISLKRGNADNSSSVHFWDPKNPNSNLPEVDAAIHLAGEGVLGVWTKEKKRKILESREVGTKNLFSSFSKQKNPPKVIISASAIGIYGNSVDDKLFVESDELGEESEGFLEDVSKKWEAAASSPSSSWKPRVVNIRIGLVLSPQGGMLKNMLPAYRFGLGGRLGDGEHWMSWISLDDLVKGVVFCLENENIKGPVNFTAPNPLRNKEFSSQLAKKLSRPEFMHVPSGLLKVLPGGFADETLLSSLRVSPKKLLDSGFKFKHSSFKDYLKEIT